MSQKTLDHSFALLVVRHIKCPSFSSVLGRLVRTNWLRSATTHFLGNFSVFS